jgi:site-specific recombinase XerD
MKNKSYRSSFVGGEVARFLRTIRWEDASENTLLSYETTLARLAQWFAHAETLEELDTDRVEEFLQENWGDAAPATRRQRLAAVKSFFRFCVDRRGLTHSPVERLKPPRQRPSDRQAYAPEIIDALRDAQATLRDQIAIQLLGRIGLRRNELRLLTVADFDMARGFVRLHRKGGKVEWIPLGLKSLKRDIEVYLVGRGGDEVFLYPKLDRSRHMSAVAVDKWFKRCLKLAGLPLTIKMHELRHSAADNLWRRSGNVVLAQQLLSHGDVATTSAYLHPNMDDLEAALEALE